MGTYEYHEFRALDRALTPHEKEKVASLSSRADVSSHHASFVYHYSSFRGDPKELLTTCFDAMLYIASWGTVRLIFSLPGDAFALERAAPYLLEVSDFDDEGVYIESHRNRVLVSLALYELPLGWVDGEGLLEPLLPIRQELLMGDDRVLYLGWLAAWCHGLGRDRDREPPVPAGLGQLEDHHRALASLFRIPDAALLAAADVSPASTHTDPVELLPNIVDALSADERRKLLLRVGRGEALQVERELCSLALAALGDPSKAPGRTLEDLERAVEDNRAVAARLRKEAAAEKKRSAHEANLARMERMEEFTWREVERRLTGKHRRYKEACQDLTLLLELAERRGQREEFIERVQPWLEGNRERAAFIKRMEEANLHHLLL